MKTRLIAVVIATATAFLISGCGGSGGNVDTPPLSSQPEPSPVPPVNPPPAPVIDNAEGFWFGATGNSARALSGVVTKEGAYWFAYANYVNGPHIGFYSGQLTQVAATDDAGTLSSIDLRDVNFETGFGGGSTAAGVISSGDYIAKTSLTGSLAASQTGIVGTFDVSVTGGTGLSSQNGAGTATLDDTGVLTVSFTHMAQTATGVGGADVSNVVDVFSGSYAGGTFVASSGVEAIDGPCAQTAGPLNLCSFMSLPSIVPFGSVSGSVTVGGGGTINTSVVNMGQTNVLAYTLTSTSNNLPSISADTLALDMYDSAYEAAPDILTLAGEYVGEVGIGASKSAANSATLGIGADGAISGNEPGGCSYSGVAQVHPTGGNFFDVRLTFAGPGCVFAGLGDFEGIAIMKNGGLTVMAMDTASRAHGFLFIGASQ